MFLQVLFVAAVACCLVVECQIDTSNCTGYSSAIAACNSDNGLTGSSQLTFDGLPSLASGDITATCGNLDNVKKAVKCIADTSIACGTTETKQLVASSDDYTDIVNTLCNRKSEYDGTCVDLNVLISCASTKLTENNITFSNSLTFAESTTLYCKLNEYLSACASTNSQLGSCSKTTTKEIYVSLVAQLRPDICGASSIVSSVAVLVVSLFAAFSN
ncbi:hypothetical protein SNE40_008311 [Patella caerulea]|uniref:Uncharacterized protein n=1 Tax=Patella caerulea TaxID=87958 RepID=A0AAN8JZU5_PATCE